MTLIANLLLLAGAGLIMSLALTVPIIRWVAAKRRGKQHE